MEPPVTSAPIKSRSQVRQERRARRVQLFHERLKEAGFDSYQQYLGSEVWRWKKDKARTAWGGIGGICVFCKAPREAWHHKTYTRIGGKENPRRDIIPVCRYCHSLLHAFAGYGNIQWATQKMRSKARKLREVRRGGRKLPTDKIRNQLRSRLGRMRGGRVNIYRPLPLQNSYPARAVALRTVAPPIFIPPPSPAAPDQTPVILPQVGQAS